MGGQLLFAPLHKWVASYFARWCNWCGNMRSAIDEIPDMANPEYQVQATFVSFVELYYPDWLFFHVPNGGKRGRAEAVRFKKMGVRPGVSDICLLEPNAIYFGYWIEFKAPKGGRLTDKQREFADQVISRNFKFAEFNDPVAAFISCEEYMGIPKSQRCGIRISRK